MASVNDGTYGPVQTFPIQALRFHIETRISRSEYTMNIFYIIGVVVVIIFVASFLGLHA
jgi:uncharacterized membrane protein YhaH (DUF805 family)